MVTPLPFCLHCFYGLLCDVALLWTRGLWCVSALDFQGCSQFGFLFCFSYRARRPWYFCIWRHVCMRQGRLNKAWCVNDRSLGDAAGKLLIWLVWSWKLTRSHWKWLPLGISFILVYLFFPSLSWSFSTPTGVLLLFLMFLVAGGLDYNLLLNLIAVVYSCTYFVVLRWAEEGKGSLMPFSLALVPGTTTRYRRSKCQVFLKMWSVYYLATCCSRVLALANQIKTGARWWFCDLFFLHTCGMPLTKQA